MVVMMGHKPTIEHTGTLPARGAAHHRAAGCGMAEIGNTENDDLRRLAFNEGFSRACLKRRVNRETL